MVNVFQILSKTGRNKKKILNNMTEKKNQERQILSKLKDTTHLPLVSSILGISALKIDYIFNFSQIFS